MALNPIITVPGPAHSVAEPHHETSPITATVGNKTYVADVNYSAGEYVAQDPAVFGAEGTGPNPQAAEEAFTNRLDILA